MCHSKDEKLDKEVAILDKKKKKGAALGKILVLNIVREINCKRHGQIIVEYQFLFSF